MIKQSTVVKRMIKDGWKPFVIITGTVLALLGVSHLAEYLWGVDSFMVYMSLAAVWFFGSGIKWAYEMKRDQIAYEQREMLREIERKHL